MATRTLATGRTLASRSAISTIVEDKQMPIGLLLSLTKLVAGAGEAGSRTLATRSPI